MSTEGSVTHWIGQLKAGDARAVQPLWERYFHQLVDLARQRLRNVPRGAADEEDVALQAFDSFCRDVQQGRFPQLTDRDGLWRLLLTITAQKAIDQVRHEKALKKGGGQPALSDEALETVVGREPSPEFAAQVVDEVARLLALLNDDQLRDVAIWKMEGYTSEEIATKHGCTERTVERRLRAIRAIWNQEIIA